MNLPAARLEIGIDLSNLQINSLNPTQFDLFVKPVYPGYAEVNLADPNLQLVEPQGLSRLPQVTPQSVRY